MCIMGAAVGVELAKPVDASDITENGTLELAKNEVIRLRLSLGHLAKGAGFADVIYDASDLVLNEGDTQADFDRCVNEVKHIRQALRLSTAGGKRRERAAALPPTLFSFAPADDEEDGSSSSSSSNNSDVDDEEPPRDYVDVTEAAEAAASIFIGSPNAKKTDESSVQPN